MMMTEVMQKGLDWGTHHQAVMNLLGVALSGREWTVALPMPQAWPMIQAWTRIGGNEVNLHYLCSD
jgi:hypothetical protein